MHRRLLRRTGRSGLSLLFAPLRYLQSETKEASPKRGSHPMTSDRKRKLPHNWIKSTLGHGDTMCSRCFMTNREAAALGVSDSCDVLPPTPKSANDNRVTQEFIDQQTIVDDDESNDEESDGEEDCGRWSNGLLSAQCRKAGSEECDWECPIGLHR
jgi:hypothetical protein